MQIQEIDTAIVLNGFHCSQMNCFIYRYGILHIYQQYLSLQLFLKFTRVPRDIPSLRKLSEYKSTSRIRIPQLFLILSYTRMHDFLMHVHKRARPCALPISWQCYISRCQLEMDSAGSASVPHHRTCCVHVIYFTAPYFPSNIAQTCNVYLYSYISLTTDNTFHLDRLYALMNDSRNTMEMHKKHFFELTTTPTNHRCVNHIIIRVYYAYVNRWLY